MSECLANVYYMLWGESGCDVGVLVQWGMESSYYEITACAQNRTDVMSVIGVWIRL